MCRTAWAKQLLSPPAALVCGLTGVLLGAGGFTFWEAEGLSYLGDESATCANCHIMREQYDGWQKASHHAWAVCNDCHVPQAFIPKYFVNPHEGQKRGYRAAQLHALPRRACRGDAGALRRQGRGNQLFSMS